MIAVIAAVLGAIKRVLRRRDLTTLAVLIALGVPMQGLVGAIVVLTKLNPFANQQHFLLSMVLVGLATVLVWRAGEPDVGVRTPAVSAATRSSVQLVTVLTGVALVTGTFVTGAGPHAGDEKAKRFHVAISTVARVHGITVMCAIGAMLLLLWRLRSRHADRQVLDTAITTWMVVAITQAAVGYTQYFTGVPAVLVAVHVALATGLWVATMQVWLSTSTVSAVVPVSVGETLDEHRALVDGG